MTLRYDGADKINSTVEKDDGYVTVKKGNSGDSDLYLYVQFAVDGRSNYFSKKIEFADGEDEIKVSKAEIIRHMLANRNNGRINWIKYQLAEGELRKSRAEEGNLAIYRE